jgi:hypothetical protein
MCQRLVQLEESIRAYNKATGHSVTLILVSSDLGELPSVSYNGYTTSVLDPRRALETAMALRGK